MTVGERIRAFREHCALTADEFAKLVGIHPVTIRKYETGKTEPSKEHIARMCHALKVPEIVFEGLPPQYTDYSIRGDFFHQLLPLLDNGTLTLDPDLPQLTVSSKLSRYVTIQYKGECIPLEDLTISLNTDEFEAANSIGRLQMYMDLKERSKDPGLEEKDRISFGRWADKVEMELMLLEHDWTETPETGEKSGKKIQSYADTISAGGNYYDYVAQLDTSDAVKQKMLERYELLTLLSILNLPERPPKNCSMDEFVKWQTQVDFTLEYYKKMNPDWKNRLMNGTLANPASQKPE